MPSPDVATYLALELVDLSEQDLIDEALARVAETFPDWTPREGNTEVVLLEALAAMAAEFVYAVNRLPDGMTETLLRLFGLERDQGAPPVASVTFAVADTAGHTIPAGTVVRLDLGSDVDPVDFTTDADLVIPAGSSTGTVGAAAGEPGITANGQPGGTILELLDAISYVDSVTLAAPVSGGRAAEDGDTFLARAIPLLSRLTTTLVRPVDVEAYVAEDPNVARVKVLDLYNAADDGSPGSNPGYVTVAVAAAGGAPIGTTARETIKANLRTRMHAGLMPLVVEADVTTVNVTLTVLRFASVDAATVQANVIAALTAYLNPDTWTWANIVRVNELIAVADGAAGVDTVLEVSVPNGDLELAGYAPLVRAGTITVTVEDPTP